MARLTGIGCSRCRSSRSSSSTRRLSGKISCVIWRLEGKIDGFVLTGKISRFSSPSCPSCNGCRCSQGCEISRISWWCSSPGTLIRKDLHKLIEIIRAICQTGYLSGSRSPFCLRIGCCSSCSCNYIRFHLKLYSSLIHFSFEWRRRALLKLLNQHPTAMAAVANLTAMESTNEKIRLRLTRQQVYLLAILKKFIKLTWTYRNMRKIDISHCWIPMEDCSSYLLLLIDCSVLIKHPLYVPR